MRLAVIDCGTNTFNILIVEKPDHQGFHRILNTRIAVKLGETAINNGFIADIPYSRGIRAIQEFHRIICEHRVDKTLAYATSAIRDARNGKDFVDQVKDLTAIDITVIDGQREAELIYEGCRAAMDLGKEPVLIMDIGGGSTEFIIGDRNKIHWKYSFNLGAARLLERFRPSDPISAAELEEMNAYLRTQLQPLYSALIDYKVKELIGSSGAFDSFVEMIHGELGGIELQSDRTEYPVDLKDYRIISQKVKAATLAERKKIKGLTPIRFDMIVISAILIDLALNDLKLERMRASTYSLKEGALQEYITKLKQ